MDPYEEYMWGGQPESAQAFPNDMRSAEADYPPDGYRARLQGTVPENPVPYSPEFLRETAYLYKRLLTLLQNTNLTAAQPAYNAPHYWSEPIDKSDRITLPAAAGGWVEALSYDVPTSRAAVVNKYGFVVRDDDYSYNGDILFRITNNGNPIPGLESIAEQRGSLTLPADTFIIAENVRQNRVSVLVKRAVAGAASVDIDVVIRGWTWRPLREMSGPAIGTPY